MDVYVLLQPSYVMDIATLKILYTHTYMDMGSMI